LGGEHGVTGRSIFTITIPRGLDKRGLFPVLGTADRALIAEYRLMVLVVVQLAQQFTNHTSQVRSALQPTGPASGCHAPLKEARPYQTCDFGARSFIVICDQVRIKQALS
jgi:hypothetical protein